MDLVIIAQALSVILQVLLRDPVLVRFFVLQSIPCSFYLLKDTDEVSGSKLLQVLWAPFDLWIIKEGSKQLRILGDIFHTHRRPRSIHYITNQLEEARLCK